MLNRTSFTGALAFAFLSACGVAPEGSVEEESAPAQVAEALTFAQRQAICQSDPRVQANVVSLDICIGADFFFRETFNGNGRTCASCHAVEQNFTIDPAFIATRPANDPLFVAEFNPALANLERPQQMRQFSLILENVDGTTPGGPNVRFTLRTTPHNLSMGTSVTLPVGGVSPPVERTGWSGDGAPGQGRLADFTNGAIGQHFTRSLNRVAGTDFRVATEQEGQAVALFMRELGRKNELPLITQLQLSDAGAQAGALRFNAVGCNGCHNNAGANTGGTNRNFNTNVEGARNGALAAFPRDGGFGATAAAPGGGFGDNTFNSTPLIEAADTGPFFHTDTVLSGMPAGLTQFNGQRANTIEVATAFYASAAFANRVSPAAPLPINAADVTNIGRFLRSINASFNIRMSMKRIEGGRQIGNVFGNGTAAQLDKQKRLAVLAIFEVDDALAVLTQNLPAGSPQINPNNVVPNLQAARANLVSASTNNTLGSRQSQLGTALNQLDLARNGLSANVDFTIGNGTLMD